MSGCPREAEASEDLEALGVESAPVQKGRFLIETVPADGLKEVSDSVSKKGRFQITEALDGIDDMPKSGGDKQMLFEIMDLQNRQIEMLYDMVRNIAGEDRLFQKEFVAVSNEVYEKLETVRKSRDK